MEVVTGNSSNDGIHDPLHTEAADMGNWEVVRRHKGSKGGTGAVGQKTNSGKWKRSSLPRSAAEGQQDTTNKAYGAKIQGATHSLGSRGRNLPASLVE